MDKIYDICCGIDVHKKLIVACLNHKRKKELREFGATTRELMELAEWLQKNECEIVAMESTGSYWKPLYNIMESYGLHAIVVNPAHMKAVPGRKTDVKDAEWIADLLQHGLLQASYIPDKAQRELRELVGYRKSLVVVRTRELNRLQKMLEGANIKLSGTVAEINGMSARIILNELLDGKTIDCVWNGMTLTDEVTSAMACTSAYCNNAQVVVVPSDKADKYQDKDSLKDLSFAVESGSAGEEAVSGEGYDYTAVSSQSDALMEVAAGTSDAAVIDLLMAGAMVGKGTGYENLTHTVELTTEKYGVGFRKGSDLADKLNEFFKTSYNDGSMKKCAETYGVQDALIEQK